MLAAASNIIWARTVRSTADINDFEGHVLSQDNNP